MRDRRNGARVFWTWLIVVPVMSMTGNVADALLHAPAGAAGLTAGRGTGSCCCPTGGDAFGGGIGQDLIPRDATDCR